MLSLLHICCKFRRFSSQVSAEFWPRTPRVSSLSSPGTSQPNSQGVMHWWCGHWYQRGGIKTMETIKTAHGFSSLPSAIGTQRPGRGSHVRKYTVSATKCIKGFPANYRLNVVLATKIQMTGDKRVYYVHFSRTCAISASAGCSAMARSIKFKKCAAGRFPWLYWLLIDCP